VPVTVAVAWSVDPVASVDAAMVTVTLVIVGVTVPPPPPLLPPHPPINTHTSALHTAASFSRITVASAPKSLLCPALRRSRYTKGQPPEIVPLLATFATVYMGLSTPA
jgi:hypothetical protein